MWIRTRYIAILVSLSVIFALMLPALASSDVADDRLAALEARVEALEEQLAVLLAEREVTGEPAAVSFIVGDPLQLSDGLTVTVDGYETGDRFRYYPSGGLSTTTLTAKGGYRLLCLYVTVENHTGRDINTTALLDAELSHGDAYTTTARDTFFYLTNRGSYAGGLRNIGQNTSVEGCLLFAIPEAAETSQERLAIQFQYSGALYECTIRDSASRLPAEGDAAQF